MGEVRPWHWALFAAAALGIAWLVYSSLTDDSKVQFADSIVLVDLQTGELVEAPFPKDRAVSLPATNPATSARTLFPVEKRDGKWFVGARYLPYVKDFVPQPGEVLVDAKAGEVKVANDSPKKLKVF